MAHKLVLLLTAVMVAMCILVAWLAPVAAEHLRGKITAEQLYANAPEFKENAQKFCPDPAVVEKIGRIDWKVNIVMFLGTWCDDSKREAPKLLKMLEVAENRNISLDLYAVDTALQDGSGLTRHYRVKAVPTIIFFGNGRELGQIIEYPKTTLEKEFLKIVGSE